MYITVNTIKVVPQAAPEMIESFKKSAPEMKALPGFLGFELWRPDEGTILAIAKWESKEAFEQYPRSEMFRRHHSGLNNADLQGPPRMDTYEGEVIA